MKYFSHQAVTICIFLLSFTIYVSAEVTAPTEIAGIHLGSNVLDYPHITQTNFMKEVVVTNWHGFRKGVISYGVCKYKDQILKIDMKYEDKSESFYKKLLKKYRKKFGKPDAFEGDSFGVMRIWKWRFLDADNNHITLALQYNRKNSNETLGSMVKLSMPKRIVEERKCFMTMCDEQNKYRKTKHRRTDDLAPSWEELIPK